MNKTILITGITGFVGKHIAEQAKKLGYKVFGTVSSQRKIENALNYADEIYIFNLLDNQIPSFNSRIDYVIHCVIDLENPKESIQRTIDLNEKLSKDNVTKSIFVSSLSMNEGNKSNYSTIKQELENYFKRINNSLILRPGLILGDGGLYDRMSTFVKNGRLIPLPDGGKYKMAVINIEKFVDYLFYSIENHTIGTKNLFDKNLISLAQIVKNIASKFNKSVLIIYIPIPLVEFFSPWVIAILRILNIKITFDSIIGYKLYKDLILPETDLDK